MIFFYYYVILDIDECTTLIHECDGNATCSNTIGNYTCACNEGYSGDGFACTGKKSFLIFS